ncbi:unnamed protein product [Protopolystoma xenopodis]|uniref:Uncharacterized protein n=1 Tax=Protopolystoma xenopodis TaxID=117903 RepID=A0A448WSM1_9PLAT|nr:unnamed protein product [Protopolystoma xenopodis]
MDLFDARDKAGLTAFLQLGRSDLETLCNVLHAVSSGNVVVIISSIGSSIWHFARPFAGIELGLDRFLFIPCGITARPYFCSGFWYV